MKYLVKRRTPFHKKGVTLTESIFKKYYGVLSKDNALFFQEIEESVQIISRKEAELLYVNQMVKFFFDKMFVNRDISELEKIIINGIKPITEIDNASLLKKLNGNYKIE